MKRSSFILTSGFCLLTSGSSPAILDTNNNGVSDFWEREYNAGELFPANFDPQADDDQDGWSNAQEAAAGTDPNDANPPDGIIRPATEHVPAVIGEVNGVPVVVSAESIKVTWPTLTGKQYTLLYSPDLTQGSWLPVGGPVIANGGVNEYVFYEVNASDKCFWRVAVTDADTDGDGLNNDEEHRFGSDPATTDTDGDGLSDKEEAETGANPNAADTDGDGLSDKEEAEAGADPNDTDTDDDGLNDAADAVPTDAEINWKRTPETRYVLIGIDAPGYQNYPYDLNDAGQVLLEGGVWDSGNWIGLPDTNIAGSFTIAWDDHSSTEDYQTTYETINRISPNGNLSGHADYSISDDLVINNSGMYCTLRLAYNTLSKTYSSPVSTLPSLNWHPSNRPISLSSLGEDSGGRIFSVMDDDYWYDDPDDCTWEIWLFDGNLNKTGSYQLPDGYMVDDYLNSEFNAANQVSPSGWLGVNIRPHTDNSPAARSIIWNPAGQEITAPGNLPYYFTGFTELPNDKIALSFWYDGTGGSVYLTDDAGTTFIKNENLSGKGIWGFAGDGTAMTFDDKIWRNGKLTPIRELCADYGDLLDSGTGFSPEKGNKHGFYLLDTSDGPKLLMPMELRSKDRVVQGAIQIPDGWENFSLSFKNKTTGEDLGTYENLEPGASTEVMIYDDSENFFSDEEMTEASDGILPDNVRNQKVVFARDPENERRLRFCTLFDGLGDVEIKLTFGPNQTEGTANITLTRDELMASFISSVNEKVLSIEVPGGDETPVDIDGDGTPDGEGSGQETGDILQGFNAGTMTKPGAPVWDGHEEDPQNLVQAINDDNDDQGGAGHVDSSDTVISASDNDIVTLLLKVPANIEANTGTMTLAVTDGSGVRIFNSSGTAPLSDYSVNLAAPSGDLSALATERRVKILVEGIQAASSITFTLTCSDAEGQPLAADTVKMMVVPRDQLVWLNAESMIQTAYGDSSRAMFRTYADNGAAQWHPISLALIGEEPVIRNRGMLAKVFFDIPINAAKKEIAWHLGYINGFWIALKGEYETVTGVWEFFTDDPYGRSAAAWAAGKEAVEILRALPEEELEQALKDIPANLTRDLYTAAENNLPWQPIAGAWSPDVLHYMGGFATGTVSEAVAISLTGVGLVAKVGTTVRGIVAGAKAGQYSLAALNALRKATLKTTHILLQLARTREEAAAIGNIGQYLGKVDFPSGKKASERFAEVFHDKPDLTRRFLGKYHDHWKNLPEARRVVRYKLAIRRVAELKELMGDTLNDDALEAFGILQKKLFKSGVDDSDRFNDLVKLWKDLDTPVKKQSIDDSLAAYKQAVQNDPDAKFWLKDIDNLYQKAYRYDSFEPAGGWSNFTGTFPARPQGWYASFDFFDNKFVATDRLLLPLQTSAPYYRFEFDVPDIKDNIRLARGLSDEDIAFEPLTRDIPDNFHGGGTSIIGKGTQVILENTNTVKRVVDLDTGLQVWPAP